MVSLNALLLIRKFEQKMTEQVMYSPHVSIFQISS